jgi:hypothetical protein
MKKIVLIALLIAALIVPVTAQAATEFAFGGYIRLDALWASQQSFSYAFSSFIPRNNGIIAINPVNGFFVPGAVNNNNHGKFLMNANASRFNFTIKGPELWGGKVTGFFEMDFDGSAGGAAGTTGTSTNNNSFNQAALRLRHAMFKITWPDQELLFGQYWSVMSELIPDVADSGAYCLYGATQLRIPQLRYTQKFSEYFNGSIAVCDPSNGRWGLNVNSFNPIEGEMAETPQIEAKLRFEKDLYGKGAWYGKPRGFYVGLGGAWFRSYNQAGNPYTAYNTFGQNNFVGLTAAQVAQISVNNQYTDHWLFLIENVTPIIPTTTKSLAGTLTLAHQWWIGKGVSAWRLDLPGNDRFLNFSNFSSNGQLEYNLNFIQRFGGWAELQYYWTEEIYTNINGGFEQAMGFNGNDRNTFLNNYFRGVNGGVTYLNGTSIDPVKSSWRVGVTQWYRPIAAVKFALQYQYLRTQYFQSTATQVLPFGTGSPINSTKYGDAHTIMANAWYLF